MNIRIYLIFLETGIIGLHFATDIMGLFRWNFSGGLHKTFLFLQVWHFGHSRSSSHWFRYQSKASVYAIPNSPS